MTQSELLCPSCAQEGKQVELKTVRALVVHSDRVPAVDEVDYRFCATQGCSVVYYSPRNNVPELHLVDVKVRVGQKKPGAPTPVCYCFEYSEEDITSELEETGEAAIPGRVRAEMKAGNCFCSTSNPSGKCCWGNIQAVVRRFEENKS